MIKISKASKVLLVVLVSIFLFIFAIVGVALFRFSKHDDQTKNALLTTLNSLNAPTGCTEQSREYTPNRIDTQPTWSVTYTCTSTREAIRTSLTKDPATKLQYNGVSIDMIGARLKYSFLPYLDTQNMNISDVQRSHVNQVVLYITEVSDIAH